MLTLKGRDGSLNIAVETEDVIVLPLMAIPKM